MWVCRSIRPGISVKRVRSMTSAPAGGGAVPTDVMRSLSITITALAITVPPEITLPARIAFVAANASGDRHSTQARTRPKPRRHEEHEVRTKKNVLYKEVFSCVLRALRGFVVRVVMM